MRCNESIPCCIVQSSVTSIMTHTALLVGLLCLLFWLLLLLLLLFSLFRFNDWTEGEGLPCSWRPPSARKLDAAEFDDELECIWLLLLLLPVGRESWWDKFSSDCCPWTAVVDGKLLLFSRQAGDDDMESLTICWATRDAIGWRFWIFISADGHDISIADFGGETKSRVLGILNFETLVGCIDAAGGGSATTYT